MVFSMASMPYLSTSALFLSPWVKQPAPPIAAADTGHALDEVGGQHLLRSLQQRHAAGLDAVAGNGLQLEGLVQALLLEGLGHGVAQAAAAGEDAAVVRGVIQHALGQGLQIDVPAVEQGLQLLKGDAAVDVGLDALLLHFHLFGGAGPNEDDLGIGCGLLNVFGNGSRRYLGLYQLTYLDKLL